MALNLDLTTRLRTLTVHPNQQFQYGTAPATANLNNNPHPNLA